MHMIAKMLTFKVLSKVAVGFAAGWLAKHYVDNH
jgi:hypothetical protein